MGLSKYGDTPLRSCWNILLYIISMNAEGHRICCPVISMTMISLVHFQGQLPDSLDNKVYAFPLIYNPCTRQCNDFS